MKKTLTELLETKTTMSEMKKIQNRIGISWDIAERKISELEDITIESTQNEKQRKKV